MDFLSKLFAKTPTAEDIRLELKQVEHEQRRRRRDLEIKLAEKNEKILAAQSAKDKGKIELVRDIFRELREVEIENGYINKDLSSLSLSRTALKSFLRKIQILERHKDKKSVESIIKRFQESGLVSQIRSAEVSEDALQDMLKDILGDEELELSAGKVKEDEGFEEFLRGLGELDGGEGGKERIDKAIKAEKPYTD